MTATGPPRRRSSKTMTGLWNPTGDPGGSENLDVVTGDPRFVDAVHAADLRVHYNRRVIAAVLGP